MNGRFCGYILRRPGSNHCRSKHVRSAQQLLARGYHSTRLCVSAPKRPSDRFHSDLPSFLHSTQEDGWALAAALSVRHNHCATDHESAGRDPIRAIGRPPHVPARRSVQTPLAAPESGWFGPGLTPMFAFPRGQTGIEGGLSVDWTGPVLRPRKKRN